MFREAFSGCSDFSYEGLEVIFNWLEETNPDYELDVIEIKVCTVENTLAEAASLYSVPEKDIVQYLNDNTIVLGITSNGIVYNFF